MTNYYSPGPETATFDNAIARAFRKAARIAKLNYGQANGFTAHSMRHTFCTHLMEVTGNDAGTVMKYSGHGTIESFSIYLKPTDKGRIVATRAMDRVGLFLGSFTSSNDTYESADKNSLKLSAAPTVL